MCGRCEPARAIKLTRNQQKLYHVRLTRVLERCSLAIMSSADVAPTRGLRDINDGTDDAPQFVDSHRWLLELDLLAIFRASSTSIPRYRTVLSSFVWPRRSCTARRFPVLR